MIAGFFIYQKSSKKHIFYALLVSVVVSFKEFSIDSPETTQQTDYQLV